MKNLKEFIDYSLKNDDIYEDLESYDPIMKRRVLIVFDDVIADMKASKESRPIVTELFLEGRKPSISFVFISQFRKNVL